MSLANAKACKKCGKSFENAGDQEIPFSFDDFDAAPVGSSDGILEAGWKVGGQAAAPPDPPEFPAVVDLPPAAEPAPKPAPRKPARKRSEAIAKKFEGVDPEDLLEQVFDEPAKGAPAAAPSIENEPTPPAPVSADFHVPLDELRIELDDEAPQDIFQPLSIERDELASFEDQPLGDGMLPLHIPEDTTPGPLVGNDTAGFFRRGAAFTVDALAILAIAALHAAGAGVMLAYKGVDAVWLLSGAWLGTVIVPLFLLGVFISALYHVGFVWLRQTTPGKSLFSLMVAAPDGGPLGLTDALFRWLGYIVSAFPFGLGFFWALFDQHKLAWHDRLSGTLVMTTGPAKHGGD
jgi:uncharacterized RDD family membrane protein YckC